MTDKLTRAKMAELMTDEMIDSDGAYSAAELEAWYIENHPHDDRTDMIADVAKLVADFCNATLNTVSI
jgi:hypothetical protein